MKLAKHKPKPQEQKTFENFGVHIAKEKKRNIPIEYDEVDKKRTGDPPPFMREEDKKHWKYPWMGSQAHSESLRRMQLRYGSTTVWREGEKFFGWGDLDHSSKVRDIFHNLHRLRDMMLNNPTWVYCGKSYQSDLYNKSKWSKKEKLKEIKELIELYKEPLFEITEDDVRQIYVDELHEMGYRPVIKVWES